MATFHEPAPVLECYEIDKIVPNLDAVILVSVSQRAYFEQFLPPERIYVVPHGIDTDFFKPAPKLSDEPICINVSSTNNLFEIFSRNQAEFYSP